MAAKLDTDHANEEWPRPCANVDIVRCSIVFDKEEDLVACYESLLEERDLAKSGNAPTSSSDGTGGTTRSDEKRTASNAGLKLLRAKNDMSRKCPSLEVASSLGYVHAMACTCKLSKQKPCVAVCGLIRVKAFQTEHCVAYLKLPCNILSSQH